MPGIRTVNPKSRTLIIQVAWADESAFQGHADVLATRSDLQNATEEVVALVMGEALQPSILRIDAVAVQAHCTVSVTCCFSMMT